MASLITISLLNTLTFKCTECVIFYPQQEASRQEEVLVYRNQWCCVVGLWFSLRRILALETPASQSPLATVPNLLHQLVFCILVVNIQYYLCNILLNTLKFQESTVFGSSCLFFQCLEQFILSSTEFNYKGNDHDTFKFLSKLKEISCLLPTEAK